MTPTLKPRLLSLLAAMAITLCLTFASTAPVVTIASILPGQTA